MADARDFLFNSDYAQDQIVFFKELEFKNKSSIYYEDIAHELDFIPLIFGVWDNNPDFDNPKPINSLGKDLYSNDGELAHSNQVLVYSNAIEYRVFLQPKIQNGSGVSTDFYIRLYAFEPPDSHATVKPTARYASKFIFNTKYNYLKLKEQGTIEADTGTVNVAHALGYVPQVLAWAEVGNSGNIGYVDSYIPPYLTQENPVRVTSSQVYFDKYRNTTTKYYYRIYYDEA